MDYQHDLSPKICIVVDASAVASPPFTGWQWEFLRGKMLRAGLIPEQIQVKLLLEEIPAQTQVVLGMGEAVLQTLTDKKGIDKWHLSPLQTHTKIPFVPTYDMPRVQKQYELGLYQELAFKRAVEMARNPLFGKTKENFRLNPSLEETYAILDFLREQPTVAVDVETGYGQINTVGFAWSESDAIAINTLPERCGDTSFLELWKKINDVLGSGNRKIFQNFIYDVSYFSAYGCRVRGEIFDTMWAMKVLWPELDMGLDNVGRIYTNRPYWKDDGRSEDVEGKKKDWGNIRDWIKHWTYNCRDTTGTLEASFNQRSDLRARSLDVFFDSHISKLTEPILEMCTNGVPVCDRRRQDLRMHVAGEIERLTKDLQTQTGKEINPRSPKQVMSLLKEHKVSLPKKYDKEKGIYRESADASSLKKIGLKHPELKFLRTLTEIKSLDKALSSYIDFDVRPDGRLSYSLCGTGTETLRFSGGKDPWGRGFNIQTIPRDGDGPSIKSIFVAPEGTSFVEIDLRQAESRFVAYDSADTTLIEMLESGADVHTHVGNAILAQMGKDPTQIPRDEFKATWRQLGKKAGHGLNYYMKPRMFCETVFSELDIVISVKDAEKITQAYYGLFPGIPRWHQEIKKQLWTYRKLTAPSGWERYFYGRYGDDMFKEAFAWRPQHTIPWIMNHLMCHLREWRKNGGIPFQLLVQVHDSIILLCPNEGIEDLAREANNLENWHPEVILPGGQMKIPVEVKAGSAMNQLKEIAA